MPIFALCVCVWQINMTPHDMRCSLSPLLPLHLPCQVTHDTHTEPLPFLSLKDLVLHMVIATASETLQTGWAATITNLKFFRSHTSSMKNTPLYHVSSAQCTTSYTNSFAWPFARLTRPAAPWYAARSSFVLLLHHRAATVPVINSHTSFPRIPAGALFVTPRVCM